MKVLVLVVNGLHCGPIGAYGNDWVGTPGFDRLAAEGVVFDQHYADAPDPVGALRSWRTGRHDLPLTHAAPPAATGTNLLQSLREAGVFTALIRAAEPPAPFGDGWDAADIVAPDGEAPTVEAMFGAVAEALEELEDLDSSWLLWVELDNVVPPWRFPEEFFQPLEGGAEAVGEQEEDEEEDTDEGDAEGDPDEDSDSEDAEEAAPVLPLTHPTVGPIGDDPEDAVFLRLHETYAAAVRYVDAGLEHLLEGLGEEVLLLVTSDRGTVLGEHGVIGVPRPWLHEELLHLPLLAKGPGCASRGRRVAALTQGLDLMPTLLECFGITIPAEVQGHSLMPLLKGDDTPVRDYACSGLQIGLAIEWSLRTPEWAFLLPRQGEIEDAARSPQLYAKPEDRWEVNDVHQHHLELCDHFAQILEAFAQASRQPGPLLPPVLRDVEAGGP